MDVCSEAMVLDTFQHLVVPNIAFDFQLTKPLPVSDEMPEFAMLRYMIDDAVFIMRKGFWLRAHGRKFPEHGSMYTESDFYSTMVWMENNDMGFDEHAGWTFCEVCSILGLDPGEVRRLAFDYTSVPEEVFTQRRDAIPASRKAKIRQR